MAKKRKVLLMKKETMDVFPIEGKRIIEAELCALDNP